MMTLKALLFAVLLSLFCGWQANTYYTGYQMNLERNVTDAVKKQMSEYQFQQAGLLTSKLDELKNLDFKVIKESQTIVERPIYAQKCIDDDGIKILEKYKDESNEARKNH